MLNQKIKKQILTAQKNEITEYFVYNKLADSIKDKHNQEILREIASDEKRHYDFWKTQTNQEIKPSAFNLWKYFLSAKIFGITFSLRLMEQGEERAQINYNEIAKTIPEALAIAQDENDHEQELIELLDEEKLKYIGSVVLGLNDALVELTGALAGFTLALQNTRLIAITGLITGIAASLSMAASEYLATKSEQEGGKNPAKAALYTGLAYIIVVSLLILPFLVLGNLLLALGITLTNAVLIILFFTFYISVAQNRNFKKRFLEMAGISLGVAILTFGIGWLIRIFFGIEV